MGHGIGHEHVAAYASGALDDSDAERFETHLATCPSCMADVARLSGVIAELADIDPDQPPPPGGLARLRAAIAAHRERGSRTP